MTSWRKLDVPLDICIFAACSPPGGSRFKHAYAIKDFTSGVEVLQGWDEQALATSSLCSHGRRALARAASKSESNDQLSGILARHRQQGGIPTSSRKGWAFGMAGLCGRLPFR